MSQAVTALLAALALLALWTVSVAAGETPSPVLIEGNSTILSEDGTFQLGFFSNNGDSSWFLGIRYASIPTPTYVWVANRENLIENLTSSMLEISETGQLVVKESRNAVVSQSEAAEPGSKMRLLDTGTSSSCPRKRKLCGRASISRLILG